MTIDTKNKKIATYDEIGQETRKLLEKHDLGNSRLNFSIFEGTGEEALDFEDQKFEYPDFDEKISGTFKLKWLGKVVNPKYGDFVLDAAVDVSSRWPCDHVFLEGVSCEDGVVKYHFGS